MKMCVQFNKEGIYNRQNFDASNKLLHTWLLLRIHHNTSIPWWPFSLLSEDQSTTSPEQKDKLTHANNENNYRCNMLRSNHKNLVANIYTTYRILVIWYWNVLSTLYFSIYYKLYYFIMFYSELLRWKLIQLCFNMNDETRKMCILFWFGQNRFFK